MTYIIPPDLTKAVEQMNADLAEIWRRVQVDLTKAFPRLSVGEPAGTDETGLTDWWLERAESEIPEIAQKSQRYGSNSLTQFGHHLARLAGREVDDTMAREMGCWAYALGKMERWTDSIMRGEYCGSDSVHDLHVYALMTLRNRETSDWP